MKDLFTIQEGSSADMSMFCKINPRLGFIFFDIVKECNKKNIFVVITSMIRPKTTDSGIHSEGRAIDFILNDNSKENIAWLLHYVNNIYSYGPNNKFQTLIWHSAGGPGAFGSPHFHLQVNFEV